MNKYFWKTLVTAVKKAFILVGSIWLLIIIIQILKGEF